MHLAQLGRRGRAARRPGARRAPRRGTCGTQRRRWTARAPSSPGRRPPPAASPYARPPAAPPGAALLRRRRALTSGFSLRSPICVCGSCHLPSISNEMRSSDLRYRIEPFSKPHPVSSGDDWINVSVINACDSDHAMGAEASIGVSPTRNCRQLPDFVTDDEDLHFILEFLGIRRRLLRLHCRKTLCVSRVGDESHESGIR